MLLWRRSKKRLQAARATSLKQTTSSLSIFCGIKNLVFTLGLNEIGPFTAFQNVFFCSNSRICECPRWGELRTLRMIVLCQKKTLSVASLPAINGRQRTHGTNVFLGWFTSNEAEEVVQTPHFASRRSNHRCQHERHPKVQEDVHFPELSCTRQQRCFDHACLRISDQTCAKN